MIKVFIADPHEIMRGRLKMLLGCVTGLHVAGQASDADQILSRVRAGGFDVLLLDPSLPPYDDIELIRRIRDEAPELKILILTRNDDEQYLSRVVKAGADACIAKTSELNQLITVIKVAGSTDREGSRTRLPSLSFA
jgi:DNA-binding NarL/FixJ family response regulator